jgi:hypothetical protein
VASIVDVKGQSAAGADINPAGYVLSYAGRAHVRAQLARETVEVKA